jgi:hypothetical protein
MSTPAVAKQLFNGRDLSGWEMVGPGAFLVENGLLKSQGGMGLLWYSNETLGNCVLRVVYSVSRDEDNSGVFIRIAGPPPDPWFAVHNGYEVQILATADEWHRSGCIYSLTKAEAEAQRPPGQWNEMEISMAGDLVDVTLNGTHVTHFDPNGPLPERQYPYEPERGPRPEAGYIGLQNHDGDSVVSFREVSVGPLP